MPNAENLKSWKPGQSGNPAGKPKGTKHWSTVVQELLNNEEFYEKVLADTDAINKRFPIKNAASAIVAAMITKANEGDTRASDWLRKTGYGDKIDITSDGDKVGGLFGDNILTIKVVQDSGNTTESDAGDGVGAAGDTGGN